MMLYQILLFIGGTIAGAIALELFWYGRLRRKHRIEEAISSEEAWKEIVNNDPDALLPPESSEFLGVESESEPGDLYQADDNTIYVLGNDRLWRPADDANRISDDEEDPFILDRLDDDFRSFAGISH